MVDLIQEDAVFKGVLMTAASYGVTKDILAEALNKDSATCNTYLMGQAVAPSDERMRVVDALFNTLIS